MSVVAVVDFNIRYVLAIALPVATASSTQFAVKYGNSSFIWTWANTGSSKTLYMLNTATYAFTLVQVVSAISSMGFDNRGVLVMEQTTADNSYRNLAAGSGTTVVFGGTATTDFVDGVYTAGRTYAVAGFVLDTTRNHF